LADHVWPPSSERRRQPEPVVQPVVAAVSPVPTIIVVTPSTRLAVNVPRTLETVVTKDCVKVGVAASAFVVRKMPPSLAAVVPLTQPTIVFPVASVGSKIMSLIGRLPVTSGAMLPALFTMILAKLGLPEVALVER